MINPSEKKCQEKILDSTYVFKKEIANLYGLEAAVLIQHFQYSIMHHKRNGSHFHEGRYWTYHSVSSLRKLYPFLSTRKIRTVIKKLLDKKVLVSGNFNKHKYDRTKWFAFHDEHKFIDAHMLVDKSVDKSVEKDGIKNTGPKIKKQGNEPFFSEISLETRRNEHLSFRTNAFVTMDKPIPIYPTIYNSSVEEGREPNIIRSEKGGKKFRSFANITEGFCPKITKGYILPSHIRKKLLDLGFNNHEIDDGILKMIIYHEKNPKIIMNEQSCVLGWFKKHKEFDKKQ